MEWFYFSVFSAVVWGVLSIIAKDIMQDTSAIIYTLLYNILGLVFYTPFFLYYLTTTTVNYTYLAAIALGFSMMADATGFIAYNYSIEEGELSRVIPFTRLTPIFASIFGFIILNETIDLTLGAGILTATIGGIVLLKEEHVNYLASVEDGLHKKAIQAAVASSIIYGAASVADRFANQIIDPEIYTFFLYIGVTAAMLTISSLRFENNSERVRSSLKEYPLLFSLTGILAAAASLSIFKAFSLAPASQVTPVLQVQVMIPVIAGVIFFGEKNLIRKLVGAAILVLGVTLVVI